MQYASSEAGKQYIYYCRQFEKTSENAYWGKAKQMEPMRLCNMHPQSQAIWGNICKCKVGKVEQMQPMHNVQIGQYDSPV